MSKKQIYECETCNARFLNWPSQVGVRHFCSRQCKWESMKGEEPHNKGATNHISKPCMQCGESITGMPSFVARRKYCSKRCLGDSLKGSIEDVLRRYEIDEQTGCWLWAGGKRGGYGRIKFTDTGMLDAHRASYEFHVGKIPEGLVIDHLCRNRSCINPAHLEPVTNAENIRRGDAGKGVRSDAHKAAISAGGKRRFQNADARSKQKAILDSARSSEKRAAALKAALNDPEYRAKKSEQMKAIWAKRKGLPYVSD